MPGTKNPAAPQSTDTSPAMRAYPTMPIPAEIAQQFTCRRGTEGIVALLLAPAVIAGRTIGSRLIPFISPLAFRIRDHGDGLDMSHDEQPDPAVRVPGLLRWRCHDPDVDHEPG